MLVLDHSNSRLQHIVTQDVSTSMFEPDAKNCYDVC